MARTALPQSSIKTRRRRRRLIAGAVAVVLALLVLGALAWLANASFLRIAQVHVSGTRTIASSSVEALVRSQLEGEYVYLFPKDNIFLYPKGRIVSALLQSLPVLVSVSVQADNLQAISVTVVERQPKALWCGQTPQSGAPCFLLDESGVAYGASLDFSGNVYIKYYGALSGASAPKQYLSPEQFRPLFALVDTIAGSQKNETVASVWVDENNDVHLAFASGFTLLFTLSADGADVYQRFTLALGSDPFKSHKLSDFEYLDLRFGDKLYYKLK